MFLALTTGALLAGPADYSVDRTIDQDSTLCESATATNTLQGSGLGDDADLLEVIEFIDPRGMDASLTVSNISVPGVIEAALPAGIGPYFKARRFVGNPVGSGHDTVYNGNDSYTSKSDTGADIWAGGDDFEFAYDRLEGNFDVSIRFDEFRHDISNGCWGKYGLMARQSLDRSSVMMHVQNHGPEGYTLIVPGQGEVVGSGGDCPGGTEGQSTGIQGRRCTGCNAPGTELFQAMFGEPTDSLDRFPDGPFPPTLTVFKYHRLTRRGNQFQGWGTNDEDVLLGPTEDARWTELPIPAHDGGDFIVTAPDDDACWYVGFGNCEHGEKGPQLQELDFTVINWTGTTCFESEGQQIRWSGVTRADVNAGLSYTLDIVPGSNNFTTSFQGRFTDGPDIDVAVGGGASVDLFGVESVGDLSLRLLSNGSGTATVDGSVYTLNATGTDIWNPTDHAPFLFKTMTGDFDCVVQVLFRDKPSTGPFAKFGPMARQTCHGDSQTDHMTDRTTGGPRFSWREGHLGFGPGWNEGYIVEDGVVPGDTDSANPDFLRLIRTGSQITGFVGWEDPNNLGFPVDWCIVGSRNDQTRPDVLAVGVAAGSHSATAVNTHDFTLDIEPLGVLDLGFDVDNTRDGALLFNKDFNSDTNGTRPAGSHTATFSADSFDPVVQDGKLRVSDENSLLDGASAVWFADDALDGILESGFVAEYDVRVIKDGLPDPDPVPGTNPGEGGMFVVVGSASDQLGGGTCPGAAGTIVEEIPDEGLGTSIINEGNPQFNFTQVNRGDPGDKSDDVYTNFTDSGGRTWVTCDDLSFDYVSVTGDFDMVMEILDQRHESGLGQWGKQGLMAREGPPEGPTNSDRFVAVHDTLPEPSPHGTMVTARRNVDDCDGMTETTFSEEDRFLRLTRRGNTIQGFASNNPDLEDGVANPNNDCNWTAGPAVTLPDLAATLFVGGWNHEELSDGVVIQEYDYRILGPSPGGTVDTANAFSTAFVGHPSEMGFGGFGAPSGPLILHECRPIIGIEVDTQVTPGMNEGAGAPDNVGSYHIGLNTGGIPNSRQTNEQFGVDPEDLPDVFAEDVHFRVVYEPTGDVEVFVSSADGGGAGNVTETKVLDTNIPPLALGAGAADPLVGFIAATAFGGNQTIEFDNLTIRRLGAGTTTGACCTDGNCDVQTQANCEAGGGTYQGDDSTCGADTCSTEPEFRRGDHDGSGLVDITDPLNLLGFLFLGLTPPICEDASDYDNSALLDISDPLNALGFLFLGNNITPAPGAMNCGLDPTDAIDDGNDPPPNGPDGLPAQPAASLGCDMYPSAVGMACP